MGEEKKDKVDKETFEKELGKELDHETTVDVTGVLGYLEGLPEQMGKVAETLKAVKEGLEGVEKAISDLKDVQKGIRTTLDETKKSMDRVAEVKQEVEDVKKSVGKPVDRKSVQGAEPIEKSGDGLSRYEIRERIIKSLNKEQDPQRYATLGQMVALVEAGGMPAREELKEFGII